MNPSISLPGRIVFGVLVLVGLIMSAIAPAGADVRIRSSLGGAVEDYLRFFAQVRQSGERVIIDGPCLSACTLVLSTIPKSRICVTQRAVLGFHAARWVDPRTGRMSRAPEATRIVTQSYPAGVRAWIKKRGAHGEGHLSPRARARVFVSTVLEGERWHRSTLFSLPTTRVDLRIWCIRAPPQVNKGGPRKFIVRVVNEPRFNSLERSAARN
jgi:hypothetical protein